MGWRARDLRALRCGNWPGCAQAMWYLQRFKRLYQKAECFAKSARFFFQARRIDPNHFEVERIMTDLDEEPGMASDTAQCIPEPAVGDLPVTLVFEIGRMTTPLSKLADLQTGDVLETTFETAPDVGIR